jgi:alkylated DNA repair dioxygenase AlkB
MKSVGAGQRCSPSAKEWTPAIFLWRGPVRLIFHARARAPELVAAVGTSYARGVRLSCHYHNECDFEQPIVSVSLGLQYRARKTARALALDAHGI